MSETPDAKQMNKPIAILLSALAYLLLAPMAQAQHETLGERCGKHITSAYIADGQEHVAPIKANGRAEFRTTFFGRSTYRLSVCTTMNEGRVVMSVYDTDKNLLFCNRDYDYSPYWDFSFTSTVTCIVQIDVEQATPPRGAVAMLAIGYKP